MIDAGFSCATLSVLLLVLHRGEVIRPYHTSRQEMEAHTPLCSPRRPPTIDVSIFALALTASMH